MRFTSSRGCARSSRFFGFFDGLDHFFPLFPPFSRIFFLLHISHLIFVVSRYRAFDTLFSNVKGFSFLTLYVATYLSKDPGDKLGHNSIMSVSYLLLQNLSNLSETSHLFLISSSKVCVSDDTEMYFMYLSLKVTSTDVDA